MSDKDQYNSLLKQAQELFPEFDLTDCDVHVAGDQIRRLRFWNRFENEVALMYPKHTRFNEQQLWKYTNYLDDPRLKTLVVIAKLRGLI